MPAPHVRNAMTVDVEDYFHASAYAHCIACNEWAAQQKFRAGVGCHVRLLPDRVSRCLLRRVNHAGREAAIFYFQPREFDPGQPRPAALSRRQRMCADAGINQMAARVQALLHVFEWDRIDRIFPVLPSSSAVLHSE